MQASLLIDLLAEMPDDAPVYLEVGGLRVLLIEACEEPSEGVVLLIGEGEYDD